MLGQEGHAKSAGKNPRSVPDKKWEFGIPFSNKPPFKRLPWSSASPLAPEWFSGFAGAERSKSALAGTVRAKPLS